MSKSVYRIIDANFNRAREAARVIEEYCRFSLNSAPLTERAKQLRHDLSACLQQFDTSRLITSRDSVCDVGIGQTVARQLIRSDLKDCFTAGCKRLTEALRALAEMTQTINPSTADTFEKLRFSAYTLEKDIVLFSDTSEKFKAVKLYVIISCGAGSPRCSPLGARLSAKPRETEGEAGNTPADILSLAECCIAGGADCIQLRAKDINDTQLFILASEFVKICKAAGVLSIINDRVDIAVAAGADGVHLGQDDLPIDQARKLQMTPLIIGKSTHSIEQLRAAIGELATYVSLGPVFSTPTKPSAQPVGPDYVTQAIKTLEDTGIGHVAVGGITLKNIERVLAAGVKTIAVCSAVTGAADPAGACRALKERITNISHREERVF